MCKHGTSWTNYIQFPPLYFSARGANVNKVNSKGYTPLHDAVKRGDLEVVTELLAYGADSALDVKAGSVY